ncbi:MAG: RluA family pseudouridine synthase [Desulfovibrionaceae bacterium]|nr:RluA family pseudouridine synthase [Desulfovibrionaceae bacterium]MBF0513258.1 RluA family pseudouridine synthase [Desulfovibrionaceae bacterium]
MAREVRNITVTPEEAGQKIVAFINRRLGETVPQSAVMRWIRTGQVRLDGGRTRPFVRVAAGQSVRLPPCELRAMPVRTAGPAPPFPVIYEDDALTAVNKPSGLPVHPGSGWSDSVQTRLEAACPGASFAPTPAHRLDRDTTGILLIAKTFEKLRELHQLFRDHRVGKEYLAWVAGRFPGDPGRFTLLEDNLEKKGPPGLERMQTGSGKQALTEAYVLRAGDGASLLRLRILTGRTHQIRAQLAARGHPLIGDRKYGGPPGAIMLHAWRVTLPDLILAWPPDWTGEWAVAAGLPETA